MHMHLKVLKFPRFVLSLAKDKDKILRNFIPQLKLDMDISYFMWRRTWMTRDDTGFSNALQLSSPVPVKNLPNTPVPPKESATGLGPSWGRAGGVGYATINQNRFPGRPGDRWFAGKISLHSDSRTRVRDANGGIIKHLKSKETNKTFQKGLSRGHSTWDRAHECVAFRGTKEWMKPENIHPRTNTSCRLDSIEWLPPGRSGISAKLNRWQANQQTTDVKRRWGESTDNICK